MDGEELTTPLLNDDAKEGIALLYMCNVYCGALDYAAVQAFEGP